MNSDNNMKNSDLVYSPENPKNNATSDNYEEPFVNNTNTDTNTDIITDTHNHDNDECDEDCEEDCECEYECECDCEGECEYENNNEYLSDDDMQKKYSNHSSFTRLIYNEKEEIKNELLNIQYNKQKDFGLWNSAKMIIAHSNNDKLCTNFFWDYLDNLFRENNDQFENIKKVYYKNDLDFDIVYEFDENIGKYIVENLKLYQFKPIGYIFNNDNSQNKWSFKITVITTKGIYSANRYITETTIGFY